MRKTHTVVAVATGLVMTATVGAAAEPGPDRVAAGVPDDHARKCIGKKKVKRARAYLTYKQLRHRLGRKGRKSGNRERTWKTCFGSSNLTIDMWRVNGKVRAYHVQAPKAGARGVAATSSVTDIRARCVGKEMRPTAPGRSAPAGSST